MANLVRTDLKEAQDTARYQRIHQKWEYAMLRDQSRIECEGDMRVRRMREALDYVDRHIFRRSKQQRMMHAAMLLLSLEQYYGEELQQHLVRLLREFKVSELRTEGLFTAPRRFGKTVGISIFAACEVVTQPGDAKNEIGHDVLIYSNNQRASTLLLLHVYRVSKILVSAPQFGGRILHLNKREKLVVETRDKYKNEVSAFPANEEKLRGTGSKARTSTVIGEEIAYVPIGIVMKILAPILVRRLTKFIGITTVNTADSFIMPLAEAKYPDGRSIMLTLNFDLVCDECKRKGRALQCKCLAADIPHWQSAARHDKLQSLMSGHLETFLTEVRNVPIDEMISPAFCRVAVDWLRTDEAIVRQSELYSEVVYTTVDPACGGRYSKFAIVSAILHSDKFIVSFDFLLQQYRANDVHIALWRQRRSSRLQLAQTAHQQQHARRGDR